MTPRHATTLLAGMAALAHASPEPRGRRMTEDELRIGLDFAAGVGRTYPGEAGDEQ